MGYADLLIGRIPYPACEVIRGSFLLGEAARYVISVSEDIQNSIYGEVPKVNACRAFITRLFLQSLKMNEVED
jgi:hypothetical protein